MRCDVQQSSSAWSSNTRESSREIFTLFLTLRDSIKPHLLFVVMSYASTTAPVSIIDSHNKLLPIVDSALFNVCYHNELRSTSGHVLTGPCPVSQIAALSGGCRVQSIWLNGHKYRTRYQHRPVDEWVALYLKHFSFQSLSRIVSPPLDLTVAMLTCLTSLIDSWVLIRHVDAITRTHVLFEQRVYERKRKRFSRNISDKHGARIPDKKSQLLYFILWKLCKTSDEDMCDSFLSEQAFNADWRRLTQQNMRRYKLRRWALNGFISLKRKQSNERDVWSHYGLRVDVKRNWNSNTNLRLVCILEVYIASCNH